MEFIITISLYIKTSDEIVFLGFGEWSILYIVKVGQDKKLVIIFWDQDFLRWGWIQWLHRSLYLISLNTIWGSGSESDSALCWIGETPPVAFRGFLRDTDLAWLGQACSILGYLGLFLFDYQWEFKQTW